MIQDDRLPLKEKFLEYFKEVPVLRHAAAYVGKDEDTIARWRKEDEEFAEQILYLKAEYLREGVKEIKSKEWLIERMFRDFSPRQEHTGADGEKLESVIIYKPTKNE
jgi:hypothetical protein